MKKATKGGAVQEQLTKRRWIHRSRGRTIYKNDSEASGSLYSLQARGTRTNSPRKQPIRVSQRIDLKLVYDFPV